MPTRDEQIKWETVKDFTNNKSGNGSPYLQTLKATTSGLIPTDRKGQATYTYDFGGIGLIRDIPWEGTGFVSFRYKVADTKNLLTASDFVGTVNYRFTGTTIDSTKWDVLSGDFNVEQQNSIKISGETVDLGFYTNNAILSLKEATVAPTAWSAKLFLDKTLVQSGSFVGIGLTDGVNTVEIQKIKEKINNPATLKIENGVETYLPANTDLKNISSLTVSRNGGIVSTINNITKFTDGIYEKIDYNAFAVETTETLINLKRYSSVTGLTSSPLSYASSTEAIPFRVKGQYVSEGVINEESILNSAPLYYTLERDVGFYRATVPMARRKIDLYESEITSWNWDGATKKWILADTNNIWTIALTLPAGIHRYKFWVDGVEVVDETNPKTYALDSQGNKTTYTEDAAITFSELVLEQTQTVEFIYQGYAKQVSLVGSFNDYDSTRHLMVQQVDRQIIRRLIDPNFIYTNSNPDYHKIEIQLPYATEIDIIEFATLIPLAAKQRVKIFLDDIPVSNIDWTITKTSGASTTSFEGEGTGQLYPPCMVYRYGYGALVGGYGTFYGYGYGVDVGYGYGCSSEGQGLGLAINCPVNQDAVCDFTIADQCFSYWDNSTDTITAAEDGNVRWCLKEGQVRSVKKITFLSRIEAADRPRQHVSLSFYGTTSQILPVTDYCFSDSYQEHQITHSMSTNQYSIWDLPTVALEKGENELIASNGLDSTPVIINANPLASTWNLNSSLWSSGSLEIIYGIAGQLANPPIEVSSVIDDETLNLSPITVPTERFIDLCKTYNCVLYNAQITPKIDMWARFVSLTATFNIEFYLTLEDAQAQQNIIGYVTASGYGTMFPANFSGNPSSDGDPLFFEIGSVLVNQQLTPVIVGNLMATFDKGAVDKIFQVRQIR